MNKLTEFLDRNGACRDGLERLAATGAETLEDAWEKAEPEDLVWIVTRPGVMSPEQRRQFLVMVLSSIEDKLTDARSKNILDKLRTKEPITKADKAAAWAAALDAEAAAYVAAKRAAAARVYAALAAAAALAARAAAQASDAAEAEAEAALAALDAVEAAAWAAYASPAAALAARAAAREQQARWIRTNFKLDDLHTN